MLLHDLSNKVVLITGIGAVGDGWGNGTTMATLFARQGAIIFGCDINVDAANKAAKQIRNDPEVTSHPSRKPGAIIVDVMQEPVVGTVWFSVNLHFAEAPLDAKCPFQTLIALCIGCNQVCCLPEILRRCMSKHGWVDILINNVGRSEPGGPAELSEETWDGQTDVNLKSVYLMCHLVLPVMEKQERGGCVLKVASIAGLRYVGKPQVAYAATKAAVIQFTKTTAVIYAQRTGEKVRLNTVVPGLMATPLVSVLAKKYAGGDEAGFRKTRDAQVPTGKMGTAFDVAHAALFLCSDEAGYITGQEITVDGGIVNSTGRTVTELAHL